MAQLASIITTELTEPVDPRAGRMAAAIAAQHPGAASAVLFYGSCLREKQLEGRMLDFYLIVSNYRAAYSRRWLAIANRLIPPNVFPFAYEGLVAKYAVLSEADFIRECGPDARSSSVFARFAQPVRLVWLADEAVRGKIVAAISSAVITLLGLTRAAMPEVERRDPLSLWRRAFTYTYGAELRAERTSRPGAIVDVDPDRYRTLAEAVPEPVASDSESLARAARAWRRIHRKGKWLSIVRLAKASFTFSGGIDYLAWKINRHAETDIEVKPWQRRWPLIGALILLPRLFARGVIR